MRKNQKLFVVVHGVNGKLGNSVHFVIRANEIVDSRVRQAVEKLKHLRKTDKDKPIGLSDFFDGVNIQVSLK